MKRLLLLAFVSLLLLPFSAKAAESVAAVFPPAGNCKDGDAVVFKTNPMRLECQSNGGGIPTGAVAYFALAACPAGWAMANGANGTLDLRGEFIRGWDAGRGVDPGRSLGTVQAATGVSTEVWGARWVGIENHDGLYYSGITRNSSDSWEPELSRPFYRVRPRNIALMPCQKL